MAEKKKVYVETSVISNLTARPLIRKTIEEAGLVPLEICTPLEMKGVDNGD